MKFDLEKMKSLLSEGLNYTRTAARLKVVEATIRYHAKKLGIEPVKKQKEE